MQNNHIYMRGDVAPLPASASHLPVSEIGLKLPTVLQHYYCTVL